MSDCELPQYYVCKDRTARKEHPCCECAAPILKGEKYLQINASWDHQPDVYRQHHLCQAACEFVRDSGINDSECVYYGGLKEYWTDSRSGFFATEDREDRKKLWFLMLKIYRRERKHKRSLTPRPDRRNG